MSAMEWSFLVPHACSCAFTSDEAVIDLGTLFLKIVALQIPRTSPWWWPAPGERAIPDSS